MSLGRCTLCVLKVRPPVPAQGFRSVSESLQTAVDRTAYYARTASFNTITTCFALSYIHSTPLVALPSSYHKLRPVRPHTNANSCRTRSTADDTADRLESGEGVRVSVTRVTFRVSVEAG